MILSLRSVLWRLLTTPYRPEPTLCTFAPRAQTQENAKSQVTVAVLDTAEAHRLFGATLVYVPFPGEQHGFRKANDIIRALQAELHF